MAPRAVFELVGDARLSELSTAYRGQFFTARERLERLTEFVSWLEGRGFRPRATRLGDYLRFYERLSEREQDSAPLSQEETDYFTFSLREIEELLWIYRGLQVKVPEGALELLAKALQGAVLAPHDRAQAGARRYQFELRIASYFLQTGFDVDLSTPSDLVVQLSIGRLLVECKRLESPRKIATRTKEAARQLRVRYGKKRGLPSLWTGRKFGLAAFDVTKICSPHLGLAVAPDRVAARDLLRTQLADFLSNHDVESAFQHDDRMLSIWVQQVVPIWNIAEAIPDARFSSVHTVLCPNHGPRAEALVEINRALTHI